MTSQWQNLLKNLGDWQGSFTQIDPSGQIQAETPTLVTLTGLDNNQAVRQTVERFDPETQQGIDSKTFEYRSLSRSFLVFDTGAFSQGSIQAAPFAEFGAEFGFVEGDRRLRLVQLFDKENQLSRLTLIREIRQGSTAKEQPPLAVEDLIGTWQGNAVTIYPDWRSPTEYATTLTVKRQGNQLVQEISAPGFQLSSTAAIDSNRLRFAPSSLDRAAIQVLLLPGGASATTPMTVPKQQAFFLEAGWLSAPDRRQRLIRNYDAAGSWLNLTLIQERKVDG